MSIIKQVHFLVLVFTLLSLLHLPTEAVQCYNCTNEFDVHEYCATAEVHHMPLIHCDNSCIYYDFSRGLFTIY